MLNILSIDDSKAVHAFIKSALEGKGIKVHDAFDGSQGLTAAKSIPDLNLVLLDWEMPVMDGPSTLKELKKIFPQLPVIMLTSKNSNDEIMQMLNEGVSEFVMKPFTPDILIEKINSVLGTEIV